MIQELVTIFFSSSLLTLALIFIFKKVFSIYGLLDNPKKYGYKRNPVPYSMGIIFFCNFLFLSFFFFEPNFKLLLILFFGFFITLLSFVDDFFDVSPKIRLFFQILVGAIIGATSIKIGYISNIFGGVIDLQTHYFNLLGYTIYIIPLLFTIFWYVLIFNALNWSDGVPGLTSGMSFLSFLTVFLLGVKLYYTDNYVGGIENAEFVIKVSLLLLASVGVFFLFDIKPKILMGDSGTMFLGFMLATITIISGGKVATVAVVFGLYLIDSLYVIFKRISSGKNPLSKDLSHIHHRLIDAGLSHKQILTLLFSITFFFGLSSLLLDRIGKIIVFIVLVFLVIFINVIIDKLNITTKKKGH